VTREQAYFRAGGFAHARPACARQRRVLGITSPRYLVEDSLSLFKAIFENRLL
jgi:hypothetical protein